MLFIFIFILIAQVAGSQNVIIVVLDGVRYQEAFGSNSTNIPMIYNYLKPAGTLFTSFFNNGITLTFPGAASILTGTWQSIANDGSQRPTAPTIFECYRKQLLADQSDCYLIVGDPKLKVLAYSTHAEYGSFYGASISIAWDDKSVFDSLISIMNSKHPRIIYAHFPDIDNAGHSGNWERYIKAIKKADSLMFELWLYIQLHPFYKNNTTLFITTDHGRHDDAHGGFQHHGDGCEGCRHIFLLAIGRGFPSGVIRNDVASQIDIAPTVATLMGFNMPFAVGRYLFADSVSLVSTFNLYQNYPNPFNPSTTIEFSIPERAKVKFVIYDIFGRVVKTLINDSEYEPGLHKVQWDGKDDQGKYVASGIYFYRLQANDFVSAKKMVLVK